MKEFCYEVYTQEKRLHFTTENHKLTSSFEEGDGQSTETRDDWLHGTLSTKQEGVC